MDKKILTSRAKILRKNQTDAENKLWYFLRNKQLLNYKFKRQYVIKPYIIDFICLSKKLVIELDGCQHIEQMVYDTRRTNYLTAKGYRILRFWNNHVLQNTDSVLEEILKILEDPLPNPLPLAGEGEKTGFSPQTKKGEKK